MSVDRNQIVLDMLAIRQRLADAGLWKTFQAMGEPLDKIGWEIGEHLTAEELPR